ncbi:MAG: hypothetical protein GXP55_17515 [Deltaproteobacteria bacterium]|nr:hypothetical protein [Deltaproteobacteria bacterium]
MQTKIDAEPSATGDREFDELLRLAPPHLHGQLTEICRLCATSPEVARWRAANMSMQAEAFERYGGAADREAAESVRKAATYLIAKAKNS